MSEPDYGEDVLGLNPREATQPQHIKPTLYGDASKCHEQRENYKRSEPQKWTPDWLANFGKADNWLESICGAHNAALAAANDRCVQAAYERNEAVKQLAAKREKVKLLVDALEEIAQSDGIGGYELADIAADALAKVKE